MLEPCDPQQRLGEDGELSFAGQYQTLLGVAPDQVPTAYKEVVASLYAAGVMKYRRSGGLHPARGLMAVGCHSWSTSGPPVS